MPPLPENDLKQNEVSIEQVEEKEFRQIQLRRYRALSGQEPPTGLEAQKELFKNDDPQHERDLIGLAISGGGIRSATFGLGLLQGLAELDLLKYVDYLSTVSGGGYIGSWLAAWVKREGNLENVVQQLKPLRTDQAAAQRGFGSDNSKLPQFTVEAMEPEPIFHLRRYGNYLAPRSSMLSTDTWSLLAVYFRNLLANMLAFVPAVLCLLFGIRYLAWLFSTSTENKSLINLIAVVTFIAIFVSFVRLVFSFIRLQEPETREKSVRAISKPYFYSIVALLGLSAIGLTWLLVPPSCAADIDIPHGYKQPIGRFSFWIFDNWSADKFNLMVLLRFAGVFAFLHLASAIIRGISKWKGIPESAFAFNHWWPIFSGVVSGAVSGAILYLGLQYVFWPLAWHQGIIVTLAPPFMLLSFIIGSNIEVALLGTLSDDREREWGNQLVAWLLIISLFWMLLCSISLFAPLGFAVLSRYLITGVGATWLVTGISGLWAARSQQTDGKNKNTWKEYLAILAPYVFLLGFSCLLSWFALFCLVVDDVSIKSNSNDLPMMVDFAESPVLGQPELTITYESQSTDGETWEHATKHQRQTTMEPRDWLVDLYHDRYVIANTSPLRSAGLSVAMLLMALVLSSRVDINEFSLNAMYANRLARCYLGASRRKVSKKASPDAWGAAGGAVARPNGPEWFPNRVTGLDVNDDIELKSLQIGEYEVPPRREFTDRERDIPVLNLANVGYWGPYPLINTALNLVAGDELAWQERKAESFTLSPLYCGNESLGFCPTAGYAGGLTLGRAVAISGAAANPNMGYHSSPAVSAMMTLFNVRLGWWLPNPRKASWKEKGPSFLLKWLAIELFSQTDAKRNFLNISDGGHFENLGAYELVRRRCRCIIVSDAAADPEYGFDDLAGLVRKCRTDFGIDIEIDTSRLRPDSQTNKASQHCVVGTIRYDQVDPAAPVGLLIYIKPTLSGDEAAYVTTYAETHEQFPQQSTADQFFEESQFEAYRALGHHIAREVFQELAAKFAGPLKSAEQHDPSHTQMYVVNEHHMFTVNLVRHMQHRWLNNSLALESELVEAVEPFVAFHRDLRSDPDLRHITNDLYPEIFGALAEDDFDRASEELHMAVQMLQVMENAFLKMRLSVGFSNPINAGWMNMMHRWSRSNLFQRYWYILRHEYSREFVQFCEKDLLVYDPKERIDLFHTLTPDEKKVIFEEFQSEWKQESGERTLEAFTERALQYVSDEADTLQNAFWAIRLCPKDDAASGMKSVVAGVVGLCPLLENQLPQGSKYGVAANKSATLTRLVQERRRLRKEKEKADTNCAAHILKRLGEIDAQIETLLKDLEQLPQALELVVWVRPAFRGQGLGRCLTQYLFFDVIWPDTGTGLFNRRDKANHSRLVTLFLPKSHKTGPGARQLKQMWLSFFSFYDFRRPQPQDVWPQSDDYEVLVSNCHWRD